MPHRNRRYSSIVADYERRFRHQVRLPNCRGWRMHHVDAQLDYLQYNVEMAWWHTGNEIRGTDLGVYGFRCPVHAALLQDWSTRCGIDWTVPPDQQADRPPTPERKNNPGPPQASRRDENLHSLAGSGRPLGVACSACGHRALVPADRLGAHSGNMTELRHLKFRCAACQSREWSWMLFNRDEDVAAFLRPASGVPTF